MFYYSKKTKCFYVTVKDLTLQNQIKLLRIPGGRLTYDDAVWEIPELYWPELTEICSREHPWKYHDLHKSHVLTWYRDRHMFCRYKKEPVLESRSLELDRYQVEGINWLREKSGRAILDDMGLGKTVQVLMAFATRCLIDKKSELLFVLCPNSAVSTWLEQWDAHVPKQISKDRLKVYNYDKLISNLHFSQMRADLKSVPPSKVMICMDEIHFLAGIDSKRFKRAEALLCNGEYHICALTGTFIRNKLYSAYGPYDLLVRPKSIDYNKFKKILWDSKFNMKRRGSEERLNSIIKKFALRRKKKDVGLEEARVIVQPVKVGLDPNISVLYQKIREQYHKERELQRMLGHSTVCAGTLGLLAKMLTLCAHPVVADDVKYGSLVTNKLLALDELLDSLCEEERVLIWSKHPKVLQLLERRYKQYHPVVFYAQTGKDPDQMQEFIKEKLKEVARPECQLVMASLEAYNTSFDGLQHHASTAIFFDSSWKSTTYVQAYARLNRRGQQSNLLKFYHLLYENSLDERVFEAVASKLNDASLAVDGTPYGEDVLKEIILKNIA